MNVSAFIPIKMNSTRVPRKNFREFDGRPLYRHIIDHAQEAGCFDNVFVDTDSSEVGDYARQRDCVLIHREPWLASDAANGNDLLSRHAELVPDVDIYCQLFATAPRLKPSTIKACIEALAESPEHDSVFTAVQVTGWFWMDGQPLNFRPGILPRSQDARKVTQETTGLYAIRRESLVRYRCRIGANPIPYLVAPSEAIDLDDECDFTDAVSTA